MFETRDALVALDRDDNESENVLFDGAEELESFLRAQRAAVQKTRDEIAEMKRFSDLRRAVKMHRRREEKLKKLNERVEKAERRVGEYVAAGWSEFTRVVDMLIEEGALYDVLLDEEAELCRLCGGYQTRRRMAGNMCHWQERGREADVKADHRRTP